MSNESALETRSNQRGEDEKEIRALDASNYLTSNTDAKSAAQEGKSPDKEEDKKTIVVGISRTPVHLDSAHTHEGGDASIENQKQRRRYQFEATSSDEEADYGDELDLNLDEIADIMKKLKVGAADEQNAVRPELERKTVVFDDPISRRINVERLKRIK